MHKKRISRICVIALVAALIVAAVLVITFRSHRNGLTEKGGVIRFYREDGTLFADGLLKVGTDTYFFLEDGTAFTGGFKALEQDGKEVYYYFQEDGTAYKGYREISLDGETHGYYFGENGSAYTGGYLEVVADGAAHTYYFQENGQALTDGQVSVEIDGESFILCFGPDGRVITDTMLPVTLGDKTTFMLFDSLGRAFAGGLKEVTYQGSTDYYYFDENGYAFTSGHKTVEEAGVTHHYYFLEDGKAYTGGRKEIDGDCYFFGSDGKALTAAWETIEDTLYYFQPDGRAAKDAFLTIDGSLYYFDGFSPVTGGWFCLGEYYYYADDQGKLATDTVVEGYVLDEQGRSSTKYRIVEIVKDLVDDSMTDQEKIDAVYYWILRNSMYYRSAYEHVKKDWVWEDSWVDDFATDLLDNWAGNCFRYAAFSGLCFREATGLPVVAYHGWTPGPGFNPIPHGWVTICQDGVWYVYDVELDKFRDYIFEVCYKEPAADSVIHIYGEGTDLY